MVNELVVVDPEVVSEILLFAQGEVVLAEFIRVAQGNGSSKVEAEPVSRI